jgi:hypothetical protein
MSYARQQWLMLAFPGRPNNSAVLRSFAPSKNGKSWYRLFATRDQAIACKRELVAAGIRYKCTKVEKKRSFPQHAASYKPRRNGTW